MAINDTGGYDLLWVDEPPDDLQCLICLNVAKDPKQHPGGDTNDCGKIFCQECIAEHLKNANTCPNCRQHLTLFRDARSTRVINDLKVYCSNKLNGCDWTGELRSLEKHLKTCAYEYIPCTNQCMTAIENKVALILRGQLNNHLLFYCSQRQYECPHCKQRGKYQEITTTHLEVCRYKVHCPNAQCNMTSYCEKKIKVHRLTTCQYEPVPCKYAAVGCKEKPLRKDIAMHERNNKLHFQVTAEKVLELTIKVNEFERIYEDLIKVRSATLSPFIFKLHNYEKRKGDDTIFHSPNLYTSYSGYKLCLSVYANGFGEAEGSHISLFVHLMKGDNDDFLTWPFTGTVTIELLNQLKDKHHNKKTILFSEKNVTRSSKPVISAENETGSGCLRFISHTDLGYNDKPKTQFLKDDNLVFRVSVEIPDYKPWLECNMQI